MASCVWVADIDLSYSPKLQKQGFTILLLLADQLPTFLNQTSDLNLGRLA